MGTGAAIAQLAGAGLSAYGTLQAGRTAEAAGNASADQIESQAGKQKAVAQLQAAEEERQARLLQNKGRAIAAASGGGVDDPTVDKVMSDIAAEGAYRAQVALFGGDERALEIQMRALNVRYAGRQANAQAHGEAGVELAQGVISAAGSYAGKSGEKPSKNATMAGKYSSDNYFGAGGADRFAADGGFGYNPKIPSY